jgi:TolB-like protein
MGEDEEATIRTLTASREITDSLIHQHRGRVVNTAGDSVLAEFASAVDAVQCAVAIQQALKAKNTDLPPARQMAFRIGINVGDVVPQGEDLYGDGVNVAARLQALADAGGIFIAGTVYDQVKNKLALDYEYLGEQAVKNIADPVRVYRVVITVPSLLVGEGQGEGAIQESTKQKAEKVVSRQFSVVSPHPPGRRAGFARRKWLTMTVIGLFLTAGVTGIVLYRLFSSIRNPQSPIRIQEAQPPSLPLPDKPSIAVLPFTNMSEDPKQEYFGDGLTADLITDLSKLSGLVVIARHSTLTYKGKAIKVQDVSKELGVRYVLEGSVRTIGDRILITAQLVDGPTGGHVWAERYERPLDDLFAVQEEVRRKILVHLGLKLTPEEEERLQRAYTPNLEAHNYVAHAFESYLRLTPADNAQAQQLCEKALALDPSYAVAYALLGFTYVQTWVNLWTQDSKVLDRAFELAQRALALDDSLPPAHELLGIVYLWRDKQHEQAIAEEERAITYSPNFFSAYNWLGIMLTFAGRPEETIALGERALRLSPRSIGYFAVLGNAYRVTKRYEEAIANYQKILTFIPYHPNARAGLAAVYSELGREEEAQAEMAEVLKRNPTISLEEVQQRLPYKDPAELERHLAALRKAGLK